MATKAALLVITSLLLTVMTLSFPACPPCGNITIPYPLSTSPTCNDPTYAIRCDTTTSTLHFDSLNTTFPNPITSISSHTQTLILSPSLPNDTCIASGLDLNPSPPFNISSGNTILYLNCTDSVIDSPLINCFSTSLCSHAYANLSIGCATTPCCVGQWTNTYIRLLIRDEMCTAYRSFVNFDSMWLRPGVELRWTLPAESPCRVQGDCGSGSTCGTDRNSNGQVSRCFCKSGLVWDPVAGVCSRPVCRDPNGCHRDRTPLIAGSISGLILLALLVSVSFALTKFIIKKKNQGLRQKFFKQNKGLLLQQETLGNEGILRRTRFFTVEELEKATDWFNETRILGQGGQGIVYKGMLSDGRLVAIKKSTFTHEEKSKHLVKQIINEIVIMTQVSHRNVVKLLGCCFETRIPLLVYEFMPNKTLSHLIYDKSIELPVTWTMRLKIAADVAGALAYLHYATTVPIFHRDVKSTNILLDEKFVAKVSDFGTSKSIELDQTHQTTQVKGTFGYIDPEFFQSSQFTEKSDVYSFGVVLVELLTGLRPVMPTSNTDDEKSLVWYFLSTMKEDNLDSILDNKVYAEGEKKEVFVVAELAKRCLSLKGEERPTMKEVAMELEAVRKSQTDTAKFQKDFKVNRAIENSDYSWTNISGFSTSSSSDADPILLDRLTSCVSAGF